MPTLSFDILARDRASKVFDQLGKKSQQTEKNLSGIGSTITNKIGPAVAGMVAGFGAFDKVIKGGFDRLANLEDANKRLEQMGLTTGQITKLMDGLNESVTDTPLRLDEGAAAIARFVSAGMPIEDINRNFDLMADAAAFAQAPLSEMTDIFERIQTEGHLTGETLNMLQVRGVPALELLSSAAGVTSETLRDMISKGQVDAGQFFDLWEQGAQGFGENNIVMEGAAKSMGDTVRGALANAETAMARLGAEILDDFMPAIRDAADAFKDFGNTAIGALDEIDQFTEATGLQTLTDKIKDFNVTGAEAFENLGKSAQKSNDVIEGFFKDVFGVENVSLMTILADETEDVADKTKLFQSAAAGAKSEAGGLADSMGEVADETAAATDAFSAYQDALKIATSPVLGLIDAVNKVDEAQRSYNEAVDTYGTNSAEAQGAAVDLFEATVGLDSAAHNADLSFAGVNEVLAGMVSQGALTAEQAEIVAGAIDGARGAAEDYTGPYTADLLAEIDDPAIRDAQRQLDAVARTRSPRYLAELDRQAEIRARNRLNAVANPRRASINAQAGNVRQVEGALDRLAKNRSMTINVGYAVTGSGLPAGLVRGRQHGGPVEANRPYIVGEAGPEWFLPDSPGLVVSNKDVRSLMNSSGGSTLSAGGSGNATVQLINQGVIGSQRELEDWLTRSMDSLRRKGRSN